jgi:hypothetical protein
MKWAVNEGLDDQSLVVEMLGYQKKDLQLALNAAELIEIEVNDDE